MPRRRVIRAASSAVISLSLRSLGALPRARVLRGVDSFWAERVTVGEIASDRCRLLRRRGVLTVSAMDSVSSRMASKNLSGDLRRDFLLSFLRRTFSTTSSSNRAKAGDSFLSASSNPSCGVAFPSIGVGAAVSMAVDAPPSSALQGPRPGSAQATRQQDSSSIMKEMLAFLMATVWRAGQGWHAPQVHLPCLHRLLNANEHTVSE